MIDIVLFGAFPYVAIVLLVVVSVLRYRDGSRFTFSSLSSQFLESRRLFWGSVPFHIGITGILLGHLIGLLIPRQVALWNGVPVRLWILEITALVFGLMSLVGLVALVLRRMVDKRLHPVSSVADKALHLLFGFQIITGLWIAIAHRWGSGWYAHVAAPYLQSIFTLSPKIDGIVALPLVARLHILSAWFIVAVFSFTRMVHVLVAPIPYLWRPHQLVIWNRARKEIRHAGG